MEQRKQARGWHQHFIGSWARLNCESIPVIPAWLVRSNLDDPRKIPYLLVWKDERYGDEIKEAVRLARYVEPNTSHVTDDYVVLKRTDGSATVLRIVWRMLPRNGGRRSSCFARTVTRRAVTSTAGSGTVFRDGRTESGVSAGYAVHVLDCATHPKAAICAEAGVVRWAPIFRAYGNLPRPESWLPDVFTSPEEAAEAGLITLNVRSSTSGFLNDSSHWCHLPFAQMRRNKGRQQICLGDVSLWVSR